MDKIETDNPPVSGEYDRLIHRHIPFIESQCRRAVVKLAGFGHPAALNIGLENESLELFNQVLDRLRQDDHKVLRQFKGSARLSTYLTAIISHQAVDSIRKKLGRKRETGKNGDCAGDKLPNVKPGRLRPGDAGLAEDQTLIRQGFQVRQSGEIVIPDTRENPEELTLETQRREKMAEVVADILSGLGGQERLILRMRFPSGHESPKEIEHIARLLNISRKAVYHRLERLLKKCRHTLLQRGVSSHDFF